MVGNLMGAWTVAGTSLPILIAHRVNKTGEIIGHCVQ